MSGPTDAPAVSTSDADPHVRQTEEIIPADREHESSQSQFSELDGRKWYEEYIVRSHEECTKCVVLILCKDDAGKDISFQNGIIVASAKSSCCIVTSTMCRMNKQVEVQFCDGTKWPVSGDIAQRAVFGMSIFNLRNVSMANVESVKFADSAVNSCEKIFTCGYNSRLAKTSFFSGSIVSGVGMKDKIVKDATLFAHGCSTGFCGHLGSSVFDENRNLVGMNILYTMSSGDNYRLPEHLAVGEDKDRSDLGGIVSALDLTSFGLGLASLVRGCEGKTIQETVQKLTSDLQSGEKNKRAGPEGGQGSRPPRAPKPGGPKSMRNTQRGKS